MNPVAQIILAVGVASMFILLSCVGIIWVVRCDPKKPHYRLPAIATVVGPLIALVIALTKLR